MKWVVANKSDLNIILNFALENEWEHTFITCKFLDNGMFVFPSSKQYKILLLKDNKSLKALVMISLWGIIFPLFKIGLIPNKKELNELIICINNNIKRYSSIMGSCYRVEPLSGHLEKNFVNIEYDLMVRDKKEYLYQQPFAEDLQFFKASPDDSSALLNLELEYQKEEVYLDPHKIKSSFIYQNLKNSLFEQKIYYVTKGISPIAKGGTNSIGHKWNQIGGVYTAQEYRSMGVSTWMMSCILEDLELDGKKTVLFVKKENKAAERVYKKLGFVKKKDFQILYYN